MKQNMKDLLLVCLVLLTVMMLLVACGGEGVDQTTNAVDTTVPDSNTHIHAFGEWDITKAATCDEDGEKTRFCDCGEEQSAVLPATGHTFGAWTTAKEASCTVEGSKERSCACGEKETETLVATGHTFGEWTTMAIFQLD